MIQSTTPRRALFVAWVSLLLVLLMSGGNCRGARRTTSARTSEVEPLRRQQQQQQQQQHEPRGSNLRAATRVLSMDDTAIVGGYTTLTNLSDSNAMEVATYVLYHLTDMDVSSSSSSGVSLDANDSIDIAIVRGYTQVVAGLNYRLLLVFLQDDDNNTSTYTSNETCLGAVAVVVYARWDGTRNITTWGHPVNCTRAMDLLNNPDEEYGPFNDDFNDRAGFESSNGADPSSSGSDTMNPPMTTGSQGSSGGARGGSVIDLRHGWGSSVLILLLGTGLALF